MSVSTLTIPTPESCAVCEIKHTVFCPGDDLNQGRHPDCPITIQQEGLRWIEKHNGNWMCPKCKEDFNIFMVAKFHFCPSCGVKLDPPEER